MSTMNYDPNLTACGRMAEQVVSLTFGVWEYRRTFKTTVRGNCTGFDVIETALCTIYESLPGGDIARIVLLNGDDEMECDDDKEHGEEWLKRMLISAEIVSITPKKV